MAAKVTLPPVSFREFVFSSNNNATESSSPATLKQIVLSDAAITNDTVRNSQKSKGSNFLVS